MIAQVETTEKTVRAHPWEPGLGRAPFRCVGMYEDRYDMGGGQSKPGGTCDYCGTGILYVFKCVSSDGKTFKVGSDCIARCHMPAERIVQVAKKAMKDFKRAKRGEGLAAKRKAAAEERATRRAAEREANLKWLATNPLYLRLQAQKGNEFLDQMRKSMEDFGGLTQNQEAAAVKILDRIESAPARKAASRFLGAVGDRIAISATVEFVKCIYQGVNRYDPDRWMTKLRTDDGALIVWFGAYGLTEGRKVTGTAKIKKLDTYQDERQNVITNPRWKDAA